MDASEVIHHVFIFNVTLFEDSHAQLIVGWYSWNLIMTFLIQKISGMYLQVF